MEPSALADLVPGVLRGLAPRRGALAKARRAWAMAAGPEIAKKTRVESLKGGILTVAVASSAVKHHLSTFLAEELVESLREHLDQPQIRSLRFRLGDPS